MVVVTSPGATGKSKEVHRRNRASNAKTNHLFNALGLIM
jgi:hypothetical protein